MSPPPAPAKPGILIVTLHEGKGFSLPPQYQQAFSSQMQNSVAGSIGAGSFRPSTASSRGPGQVAGSMTRPQSTGGGINAAPTIHGRYSSRYLPYVLLDFDKVQVFVDAVSGTPENPYWAGDNTQYKFDVSRTTELSAQVYLRNPAARPGSGRNDDIFLGACKIKPRFEEVRQYQSDPKASKKEKEKDAVAFAEKERLAGQAGADWSNLTFGTGSIRIGVNFVENRERALKMEDFELLKVVGKGSFGKVMQVMYVMPMRSESGNELTTAQEEGYSSDLRSQDTTESTHHIKIRSSTHAGGAISSFSDQQSFHRAFEVLFPVSGEALLGPRIRERGRAVPSSATRAAIRHQPLPILHCRVALRA